MIFRLSNTRVLFSGMVLFLATVLLSTLIHAKPRLVLTGPPWPPYLNDVQVEKGLATEIVVTALRRAGYDMTILVQPWSRVLHNVRSGFADVLVGVWESPERKEEMAFSKPYYINEIVLYSHIDKPFTYHSLSSLQGLRIGVRQNGRYLSKFDHDNTLNKIEVPRLENLLKMLMYGRLDVVVGDNLIAQDIIAHNPDLQGKVAQAATLALQPLSMAVRKSRKDHQVIVEQFNKELAAMSLDGELDRLYQHYHVNLDSQAKPKLH